MSWSAIEIDEKSSGAWSKTNNVFFVANTYIVQ